MSLSYAAILPHNPVLIPNIGKEHIDLFYSTFEAVNKVSEKISQTDIDTVMIISPHAPILGNAFGINLANEYLGDFKKFGDLATKISCKGDVELAYKTKESLETQIPIQIYSETELDYGTCVPMFHILQKKPELKIIAMNISELKKEEHFKYGQLLFDQINLSSKKIAVVGSMHLSHSHDKSSKKNYHPDGKKFDNEIKKSIKEKNYNSLLNLAPELVNNAKPCGLEGLNILQGVLSEVNYQPKILSYEIVFSIGHLTAEFIL